MKRKCKIRSLLIPGALYTVGAFFTTMKLSALILLFPLLSVQANAFNLNAKRDVQDRAVYRETTEINGSQQKAISGKVTDSNGQPLPGVTVVIKGTTQGTITGTDGSYNLVNIPADATLVFSFVGMRGQELTMGSKTRINVVMLQENIDLEEIVAVGYGSQSKKSLTGAISNMKAEELQTTTATSLTQKLQGKVSGLNIRQNTGEPGDFNNTINIRGFGSPLYVIDGIVRTNADFQKMNGEDIESVTVLKDASAAIYGLNAANGVIIITTKKGQKGKTRFQFTSNLGLSAPTDVVRMANAYEYYTLRNEANVNIGLDPLISNEELAKWKEGGPGYESTDWYDETFHKHAVRQEYSISADGGSEKVSYYFNANYTSDGGLLLTDDLKYDRFSFRSNIIAQLTDNLSATVSISGYSDEKKSPSGGFYEIWRGTVSSLPIKPVYANNNESYLNRVQDGQSMNPVALSNSDLTGYSQSNNDSYQTSLELKYQVPFVKGLELKGVAAYDKRYAMGKGVSIDYELYDYDSENDVYVPTSFNKPASISNSYDNIKYLTLQAQASYKTTLSDHHNINATVVYEQRQSDERYASILKYYDFYTNDQIDQAGETNAASGGNEVQTRNRSYLGRLNYDYSGKYLIEFAARYDGSYRYHPDVRWGFFPLVSGGWRISEENFMKTAFPELSNLKIRGSYGVIGEDAGDPFQYIAAFSTSGGGSYEFTDGVLTNGVASPALTNERLTWMESKVKNVGFDFGILENKLSFSLDVYRRDRTGLLAYRNVELPNTYGGTFPQENLNSDRVQGIEFSFGYRNTAGEFAYDINGNINFARSKNIHVESAPFTSSFNKYRNGSAERWSDIVWTYNVTGQFQREEEILNAPIQNGTNGNKYVLPGDWIYEDVDGDGVINSNDMTPQFYDDSMPKMNFGLTFNAAWKGFDLSMLFQGAAKFTARYTHAYTTMFWQEGNLPAYFMDRWHRADPADPASEWVAGKWPAMRTTDYVGMLYEESNAWRKDCSYLRFKNIELGYTFNRNLVRKAGISKIRLFLNINNVYTWANKYIKAFDPEKIAGSRSTGWVYPISRSYTLGVNLDF